MTNYERYKSKRRPVSAAASRGNQTPSVLAENYLGETSDGLTFAIAPRSMLKKISSKPWFESDKWSRYLEENCKVIKDEFFSSDYKTTEHPGNQMLAENGKWSSITLIGAQGKNLNLQNSFGKTFDLLKKMPINETYGFVAFSKLSPGTHIKPHTGSSNLRLRYHLGIDVPEPDMVKIRVGDQTRPWP